MGKENTASDVIECGLAKGTRIHTKDGLKPIEAIKAGDYVLASPEDGSGSPEYKRVLRTFVYERKIILNVRICGPDSMKYYSLSTSVNFPVWVDGRGWMRADALKEGNRLYQADGEIVQFSSRNLIYRTEQAGVGWTPAGRNVEECHGSVFDYANCAVVENGPREQYLRSEIYESDEPLLRVTVYNLEVEDYHTYYAGGTGFRMHDGIGLARLSGRQPPLDSGFTKGMRVHARDGQRPIEEIKVGDYVLSSPEDGSGRPEYKRVLRTLACERKTIVGVRVCPDSGEASLLAATGSILLWVDGAGWMRADAFTHQQGRCLRRADGSVAKVAWHKPVYRTERDGVGWIRMGSGDAEKGPGSAFFDYINGMNVEAGRYEDYLDYSSDEPFLKITVYHLEVEDYHTYYVNGCCVHDAQGACLAPLPGQRSWDDETAPDKSGYEPLPGWVEKEINEYEEARLAQPAPKPEVCYPDGTTVEVDDAVLLDDGLSSGRVTEFLFSGGVVAMVVINKEEAQPADQRCLDVADKVVQGLQLVERNTSDAGQAAVRFLNERAHAGEASSMFTYGLRLLQGIGLPKDRRAAQEWLTLAADKGNAEALYVLGKLSADRLKTAQYWRLAAKQGHLRAQFELGLAYQEGNGVPLDAEEGMHWYGMAYNQGNLAAYYNLGHFWIQSPRYVRDVNADAGWFRAQADQGDAPAQWVTGLCAQYGQGGTTINLQEAVHYYRMAAEQHFGPAQCNLADKYEHGAGVERDLAQALHWYLKAADKDIAAACFSLGEMYRDGRGVPQDNAQAIQWFERAARLNFSRAEEALQLLRSGA